ncbi:hypothetical protein PILCRDRAFT_58846 [Piloderma croceum F 1598]|uniref:Protein YTP1-like C-terminal domain-containing protein n=1 Tax=Piloderma croceum (strain F 1598) TaxID=765440 RepID=A0A0C3GH41_PILCF|nr:hypothetical protein PILCRDRAFT_58846 [Piloderma croceum F 1598]
MPRDGHSHHDSHSAPLLQLNETEVLMHHAPTPPSYWTIDIDEHDPGVSRHPGLMILHGLLMSLAFFIALPVGIAMRSVKHAWHGYVVIVFYGLCVLGCAASALYTKLTPNMYENQKHSQHGYFVLFASACLSILDLVALLGRLTAYIRSRDHTKLNFYRTVILGREEIPTGSDAEYAGLVVDAPEEFDEAELKVADDAIEPLHVRRQRSMSPLETVNLDRTVHWTNDVHRRQHSSASERTLFSAFSPTKHSDGVLDDMDIDDDVKPRLPLLRRIARGAFGTAERALVFAGYCQLLTGIVVYTGGCRQSYVNGCLAHLIKGSIFWCYGLVTFARFLGSFSELGWAWNRAPSGDYPSAEFVESFVIFLYGVTNTWMERFGAHSGDPYTTKQMQHISIAVMFWFAGLLGMGIESKRVRRWLAASASATFKSRAGQETVAEPPSYIFSFNPFPALVIGVTGAAMSAHAQTYLFQVQIHALWGYLLLAFSILRWLTYFFVWLGPPHSILPSRPPTEALSSFFLACGGLTFIFSTEEITFAAMRRGRDDVMLFMNLSVALTCFAFCWTFCVVAFKGWLRSRSNPPLSYHNSA